LYKEPVRNYLNKIAHLVKICKYLEAILPFTTFQEYLYLLI